MDAADAILQAVKDGDARAVERLLHNAPALGYAVDEHHKTPLHWAAELDRCDIAETLLDSGADIEAKTSWGATPFDWAAHLGSSRVADVLLSPGAQGMSLVAAASPGKLEWVRALLDAGGNTARRAIPEQPNDHWVAESACMRGDVISDAFRGACRNGHTAVAEFLLARGASTKLRDSQFDATPEQWAVEGGHKEIRDPLMGV
jgi:ankyrin repeat protein